MERLPSCRYLPGQLVLKRNCQVGQVAQLRRYLPGQLVAEEDQPLQVGQVAQLRRYLPGQLVAGEGQSAWKVAQFRRYLPGQLGLEGQDWRGCPAPSVSPRSTGCWRGIALSGWTGCPAPSVSPRSTGCWRGQRVRLERLPSSVGISPVNWLSSRDNSATRPSSSVTTPCHSRIGSSLSQLVLSAQFVPPVSL